MVLRQPRSLNIVLIEQAKRDFKISRDIPLGEVADFTILRDVQKELGLR